MTSVADTPAALGGEKEPWLLTAMFEDALNWKLAKHRKAMRALTAGAGIAAV